MMNKRQNYTLFINNSFALPSILMMTALFFLTGCGYRAGYDGLASTYHTISIPYAEGDLNGQLTAAIISEVNKSGAFQYVNQCGNLRLIVKIIDFNDQNIGFRYDRHKDGRLRDTIIPVETRLFALAEVTLIDNMNERILLGPTKLSAHIDFDHDYYSSRNEVNVFSLGQLSDYDAAYDAANTPLNNALARIIIGYISDSW